VAGFAALTPRGLGRFFGFTERGIAFFGLAAQCLELVPRLFAQDAVRDQEISLLGLAIIAFFAAALEPGERILIGKIARLEAVALGAREVRASPDARSHSRAHGAARQHESDATGDWKNAHLFAVSACFFAFD
jgi:hypothetical protein